MNTAERKERKLTLAEDGVENCKRDLLHYAGWQYVRAGGVWHWRKLIGEVWACMSTSDAIRYERNN